MVRVFEAFHSWIHAHCCHLMRGIQPSREPFINNIGNEVKLMPGGYFPVQGNEGAGSVLHTLFQVPGYFVLLRDIDGDCLNLRAGQ